MDIFEVLKQRSPGIIIFAVVVSTLYNVGFFTAAGSADLITNLSYQDILTTSIFAIAIIIPAFLLITAIQRGVASGLSLNTFRNKVVYIVVLIIGFIIVYSTPSDFVGWAILTVLLVPLAPNLFEKIKIPLPKEAISNVAILFIIAIGAFGNGYGYYASKVCVGQQYYSTTDEKQLILKIYSNFLVLYKSDNQIEIKPNDHKFSIISDSTEAEKNLQTRRCNPIRHWINEFSSRIETQ